MYVVVTDSRIVKSQTLKGINRKLNSGLQEEDFKVKGLDKIIILGTQDLDFVQDLKRISLIPMQKLYKEDNYKYMFVIMFILQIIILVQVGGK